jgi:hypothetical protein
MIWGFCSDLRRESAYCVFCLEVRGVVEFGERIEEAVEGEGGGGERGGIWGSFWRRREREKKE